MVFLFIDNMYEMFIVDLNDPLVHMITFLFSKNL